MDRTLLAIAQVDSPSKLPSDLEILIGETLESTEKIAEAWQYPMRSYAAGLLKRCIKREEDKERMDELVEKFTQSQTDAFKKILEQRMFEILSNKTDLKEKISYVCSHSDSNHLIHRILPPINETTDKFVQSLKEKTDGMQSIQELKLMIDSINNQIQSYENERITLEKDFSAYFDKIEDICSSGIRQNAILS